MPRLLRRPAHRSRALLGAPALALAGALCLAGCGSGGAASESKEHSVVAGVNGQIGQVLIRNAQLTLGLGGTALMGVALVNLAGSADALTGLSSTQASAISLPSSVGVVNAYGNPSDNPGNSFQAADSGTPTATGATVRLPSQLGVFIGTGLNFAEVTGLAPTTRVGDSVPVTFTFLAAGSVTLQVPVTTEPQTGGGSSALPTVSDAGVAGGPTTPAPGGLASTSSTSSPTP